MGPDAIIAGKFEWPVGHTLSPSVQELITSLLNIDPNKRPTADQAIDHPWIGTYSHSYCVLSLLMPLA